MTPVIELDLNQAELILERVRAAQQVLEDLSAGRIPDPSHVGIARSELSLSIESLESKVAAGHRKKANRVSP